MNQSHINGLFAIN